MIGARQRAPAVVNAGIVTLTLGPNDGTAGFSYTVTDGIATDSGYVTLFVEDPL